MSDESKVILAGIAMLVIGIMMLGLGLHGDNKDKQITVLQTQLADAKDAQKQADYKFKLCMERK